MGKKKRQIRKYIDQQLGAYPSIASNEGEPLMNRAMTHHADARFVIYQIKNGFTVVCYGYKIDKHGNVEQTSSVHYVETVNDIPKLLSSNSAAHLMGVV